MSLVLELISRAFEPARATRKLSRWPQLRHRLHGDVPGHPRRRAVSSSSAARTVQSCGKSILYHTRNRRCFLKLRKTSEACVQRKHTRGFSTPPRLLVFLLATRGFFVLFFRLYVYSFNSSDLFSHIKERNGTRLRNFPPSHHICNTRERSIYTHTYM